MSGRFDELRLKNQTGFPIYLCGKEIANLLCSLLDPYGLTYTQFIIMTYLWETGGSNVKDASDALMLDPSTLTPILKKLEGKGYITRERDENDERNLMIKVTEAGEKLRIDVSAVPKKVKESLGLSSEETKTIRELMYKMLINLKKEKNNAGN